ncbi:hypothetical protein ACFY1S_13890 [Micromonospora sp. NPDC000663]|uniref:hypothetical protein n=1 Tax=Micromonospora sp. NPDC000663 TaxID=3364218 RepID=UPI0036BF3550
MDEITDQLRAATAVSPPTRIDVDRLIADGRQRRQNRMWTLATAGVVAVVAAVAVTPALFAGLGNGGEQMALPPMAPGASSAPSLCGTVAPSPSGPEPPLQTYDTVRSRPVESPRNGEVRLTAALHAAVDAVVPTDVTVVGAAPECAKPQFAYHSRYREYTTIAMLGRDGVRGHLIVAMRPTAAGDPADCAEAPDDRDCQVRTLGDDGVVVISTSRDPGGGVQRWVQLRRVDGTSVTVTADNIVVAADGTPKTTAPEPLLTSQELVELARAPGLTLYP